MMNRVLFLVLLLASPIFAQDDEARARMAAGCGPSEVNFDVRVDKKSHPTGQPEPGKALVYVFGDEYIDNVTLHIGSVTTRVGVDGTWVGAKELRSYFFFQVTPGDHRLCTSRQSRLKSQTRISAALSFAAEAGKVYYFRIKTPEHPLPNESVGLVPVDPAQAQLLIASSAYSTFRQKK
jgi:hypothetical protein